MDDAVVAVVAELEMHLAAIVERAAGRHARELEVRRIHGVYPGAFVRVDHVVPTDGSGEVPDALETL